MNLSKQHFEFIAYAISQAAVPEQMKQYHDQYFAANYMRNVMIDTIASYLSDTNNAFHYDAFCEACGKKMEISAVKAIGKPVAPPQAEGLNPNPWSIPPLADTQGIASLGGAGQGAGNTWQWQVVTAPSFPNNPL